MKRELFIKKIAEEVSDGNLAIFAGAGLSIDSGGVSWNKLLAEAAEEIGLDIEKETDLISLTQFYINSKNNNKGGLAQKIYHDLNLRDAKPSINHKLLARMPISAYWTTNYDKLIEDALEEENKLADVKYDVAQFLRTVKGRDATVYKMHGDIEHPNKVIITRRDFEVYHETHRQFISTLYGDLTTKTFLFLGLSFTDPNLFYVLSRVRIQYETDQREHYAIIKRISEDEFSDAEVFEYSKIRQELFIKDLLNYNITVFLIDRYEDLTEILKDTENKYRRSSVFFSGSAHTYGSFSQDQVSLILEGIIDDQFKNKRKIINGYGLGFGDLVVGAAVRKISGAKFRNLQDHITVRPFPQKTKDGENLGELWRKYREDMISRSGIAVFMFGNKLKEERIIEADGMYQEFEIAKQMGLAIVPVGITGYMAKTIWQRVYDDFGSYFTDATQDFRSAFDDLNKEGTIDEITQRVNRFIGLIISRRQ